MASKKKRTAEVQLTKDAPEDESSTETQAGSWSEAPGEKLKQRKILKVKRKDGEVEPNPEPLPEDSSSTKAMPSFDFGVDSGSESAPSFDFAWKGTEGEKEVTSATAETETGKEESTESGTDSGSTSWNFGGWGSDSGGFGAFDASAFKSFGSVASSAGTESAFTSTGSESLEAASSSFVEPPPPVTASAQIFKDKKAEKAGTEDDQTLIRVQSKVYVVRDEASGDASKEEDGKEAQKTQFVESGHGDLHVNLFQEEGKTRARLVLRMEKTQRLVLNAPVFKDMDYKVQGDKFLRIISCDLEGKPTLYLLKFKTKQDTQQVKAKIDAAVKVLGEPYGSETSETEQTEETAA